MKKTTKNKIIQKVLAVSLALGMAGAGIPLDALAQETSESTATTYETGTATSGKLENGSFEVCCTKTGQQSPEAVSPWKTTAETQKVEVFGKGSTAYIKGPGYAVKLSPSDGKYAVELNADEESSLYQVVNTEPSSLYEWGLDHGSRTASETMALIIGPNQTIAPSKSWGEGYETEDLNHPNPTLKTGYKYGKDQMMQMVSWLKAIGEIGAFTDNKGVANEGQAIILYSKKFAAHGEFEDNADEQPFSMEPSSVYTEKWYIWLMTDHNTTVNGADNPWGSYGLNGEKLTSESDEVDLSKYNLYTVPTGQTETIFSFTSVENSLPPDKSAIDPTFGNFLDNINFQLYHSLAGSTTAHGSAVVGSSDGLTSGSGSTSGHAVTVGNSVATYISDGQTLEVQAKVASGDASTVSFVGVYYTVQNPTENGTITTFIPVKNNSDWHMDPDVSGNLLYTYDLKNVTSAVNLHFVFIKSPLITYDVNGGIDYKCTLSGSNSATEAANVYSFKPTTETGINYIAPYTSHIPEGQNDAWKFMGWKVFDDNGAVDENRQSIGENGLLQGVHTIACNYEQKSVDGVASTQNFVIIGEGESFMEGEQTQTGKAWDTSATKLYNDYATGLSLVAQWRWRQTFIPQTNSGTGYLNSDSGGSVLVTSVTDNTDENYVSTYNGQGAKAYYASTSEKVQIKAVANDGYYFNGWYDENGNMMSSNPEMSYIELKESTKNYYARFSLKITQQFKRQIQVEGIWITLEDSDTKDGKLPLLDHTSLCEGIGTVVSATATNSASYGIIGWYDADGNEVDSSMICNDGKSIRYAASEETTYYARYTQAVTINFKKQYVNTDGSLDIFTSSTMGTLSVATVNATPGDVVNSKAYPSVGYRFVGWFDGTGTNAKQVTTIDASDAKIITPTATDTNGITYYARFTAKKDTTYTVKHRFYKEGANIDSTTKTDYTDVIYTYCGTTGEKVTPIAMTDLSEHQGYIYREGIATQTITANGAMSFTLKYTKTKIGLTYNKNTTDIVEGSVTGIEGYVGWPVTVSENEFVRPGYEFNGWNTAIDGSGTDYSAGDTYMLLDENILYAQWVKADSVEYTVQYMKLDKTGNVVSTEENKFKGTAGSPVKAKEKVYDGYRYQEKYDENGNKLPVEGIIAGDGSLVLKLYYTPNSTKIVYKANGGIGNDIVKDGVVNEVVTVNDGSSFTRVGYTFSGWKTPSGTVLYKNPDTYTLTTAESILLAQWEGNVDTAYKILHYIVSADGTKCTLKESEEKKGTTNASVTATPRTFEGYTYKSDLNSNGMITNAKGFIAGDGSLVLRLYYVPNTINLTYDANGGTGSNTSITRRANESIVLAQNPFSRPGYTFTGWNTEKTPTDSSGVEYAPNSNYQLGTGDSTLYAQWAANVNTKYTVEYYKVNAAGTTATLHDREELMGTTDTTVTASEINIKGFTYKADYSNGDMKTIASGVVVGDESLILKLYYMANTEFLYYYANDGGGDTQRVQGYVDEEQTIIANPYERTGYTFTGWNTSADGEGTAYDVGSAFIVTADENKNILYAQWSEINNYSSYGLIYDANGGSGAPSNEIASSSILVATHEFTVSETEPMRAGYTFNGWRAGTDEYKAGDNVTVNAGESVELIAQWTKNPVQPTITTLTYRANGGAGDDYVENGDIGESKIVLGNMFSRDNYIFTGWNTEANGSGTSYAIDSTYTLTEAEDILYAQWEEISVPPISQATKLTYKSNSGVGGDYFVEGNVNDEKKVLGSMFSREGFLFVGWNTIADGSGTAYAINSIYTLTENDDVLYAQWEAIPEPPASETTTLTYKPNGALGEDTTVSGNVNDTTTVISNPYDREGYYFVVWSTTPDLNGTPFAMGRQYTLSAEEDILYAIWEEVPETENPVKLTYVANGGSGLDVDIMGILDENTTLMSSPFFRTGYRFVGWGTATEPGDISAVNYEMGSTFTLATGEIILYAQWEKIEDPPAPSPTTLTYKANGGIEDDFIVEGNVNDIKEVLGNMFSRDGYMFIGWNTSADGTGTAYEIGSDYTLTDGEDILYVQWEVLPTPPVQNATTLTYKSNGGDGNDFVVGGNVNDVITVLGNMFSRDNYIFKGWNTVSDGKGTAYEIDSKYTLTDGENILYAQWEVLPDPPTPDPQEPTIETTTLTYKPNGGTGKDYAVEGNVNDTTTVLDNMFSREGYVFKDWNIKADGSGTAYTMGSVYTLTDGEDILYAQWEVRPDPPTPDPPEPTIQTTTLTYKPNGGTGNDYTVEGNVNDTTTVLDNMFSREGYVFNGWNTEADGSGTTYTMGSVYTLTTGEDILYAQWDKKEESSNNNNNNNNNGNSNHPEPGNTSNENNQNEQLTNEQLDKIPQTGDDSRLAMWFIISLLSGIGAVIFGKRRKEDASDN